MLENNLSVWIVVCQTFKHKVFVFPCVNDYRIAVGHFGWTVFFVSENLRNFQKLQEGNSKMFLWNHECFWCRILHPEPIPLSHWFLFWYIGCIWIFPVCMFTKSNSESQESRLKQSKRDSRLGFSCIEMIVIFFMSVRHMHEGNIEKM